MAFSVTDIIENGASSTIFVNPVESQLASLKGMTEGLGDISKLGSGISSAMSGIADLQKQASDYVASSLESLKTKLPLMNASDTLEKKLAFVKGTMPSIAPGSSFTEAFGGLFSIEDTLTSAKNALSENMTNMASALGVPADQVKSKLNELASQAPSPTIPDPADPSKTITNPAYTDFLNSNSSTLGQLQTIGGSVTSSVTSAIGLVTSAANSEKAALGSAVTKLKDMAFADFASKPQLPGVKNVLQKFVKPPAPVFLAQKEIMGSATTMIEKSKSPLAAGIASAPVRLTDKPATAPLQATSTTATGSDAFFAVLEQNKTVMSALLAECEALEQTSVQWQASVNYAEVRKRSEDNPGNAQYKSEFESLKQQLISRPEFVKSDALNDQWVKARDVMRSNIENYKLAIKSPTSYNISTVSVPAQGYDSISMQKIAAV